MSSISSVSSAADLSASQLQDEINDYNNQVVLEQQLDQQYASSIQSYSASSVASDMKS
jgi:hypothetical protein